MRTPAPSESAARLAFRLAHCNLVAELCNHVAERAWDQVDADVLALSNLELRHRAALECARGVS